MIILDMGSGETCKNDFAYVKKMIEAVPDTLMDVVIKWQLFADIPPLTPLKHDVYLYARDIAERRGFKTASSVFDEASLDFLLGTDPAFVKIACRPHLYPLIMKIPEDVPVVVSVGDVEEFKGYYDAREDCLITVLCCVADYPAESKKYVDTFGGMLKHGISDHTEDWFLYKTYQPEVYECHFCLDDSTGPDAAKFARRPDELRSIL